MTATSDPRWSGSGGVPAADAIVNPPGLGSIAYRAGDFGELRRALLTPQAGEQAIGDWRPAPGDLGLQALEWWAYLGDILTFYNERYANESYLRTATRPQSVANLVGLLGYTPAPGVAATGVVAAARKPGFASEPLVVPAGMKIASTASAGVPAQTFEVDAATSFTGPTEIPVSLPRDTGFMPARDGSYSVVLAGRVGNVKPGDRLLLIEAGFDATADSWASVTVTGVETLVDPETGSADTKVTFALTGGWGPSFAFMPALYELEQVLSRFQDRSTVREWYGVPRVRPPHPQASSTAYRLLRPVASSPFWSQGTGVSDPILPPAIWGGTLTATLSLGGIVRSITPGDLVLVEVGGEPVGLGIVTAAADTTVPVSNPGQPTQSLLVPYSSLTALVGSYSSLALLAVAVAHNVANGTADAARMLPPCGPGSAVLHHGLVDVGTIVGAPQSRLATLPATVNTSAAVAPALGSTGILTDAHGSGVAVTVGGRASTADTMQLTLIGAGSPPASLTTAMTPPLQLLLDVVKVSRGQTVTGEVLGSGNAAYVNQSFTLAKTPLTYLPGPAAPTSTLEVYVNGLRWSEVASFYEQPADARVYVVTRSADETVTTVTFGDGVNGSRLPSGGGNVTATYRYGSGSASPPAGRLTTIMEPQPNLTSIQNPVAVLPGADPQPASAVRAAGPASVSTFGRAISASDYIQIAAQTPGVARVSAAWGTDAATQRPALTVYVGDDAAAVSAAAAALAGTTDPDRPVIPVAASPIPIEVSCITVVAADRVLADVVADAQTAIADPIDGLFSPARTGIGQPLYRSAVMAALSVPGVLSVEGLLVDGSDTEVLPGVPGAFFTLAPGGLAIQGVSADV